LLKSERNATKIEPKKQNKTIFGSYKKKNQVSHSGMADSNRSNSPWVLSPNVFPLGIIHG
jgi:hypothetical protein